MSGFSKSLRAGVKRRNQPSGFVSWTLQTASCPDEDESFEREDHTEIPHVSLDGYFLKLEEAKGNQVIWVANTSDERPSADKPA